MSYRGGGGGGNGWEGSTAASSRATTAGMAIEEAANDSAYMQKLLRKLRQCFMSRGVNGIPQLQSSFRSIDIERERHVDVWEFKSALADQGLKLSDREKEVLFYYHDVEGTGEIDMDSFLAETRERFSSTHQQIDDIFRKIRSKTTEIDRQMKIPGGCIQDLFQGIDITSNNNPYISSMIFYKCFRRYRTALGLSPSDIVFMCRFFEENSGRRDDHNNTILLQSVLSFLRPPSTNQVMNLVLLKLRDAIEDRDRTHSGSIGLARLLMRVGGPVQDIDRFKQGMKSFGCALRDSEVDLIFEALHENNTIQVESVISLAQQDPLPVTEDDIHLLLKKFHKELITRHQHGIVNFRHACRKYDPDRTGLIDVYCLAEAARSLLTAQQFPDLEVEILFNRYRSRNSEEIGLIDYCTLIKYIRGPVSNPKQDIVNQIWDYLDPQETGFISHEHFKSSIVNKELVPDVFSQICSCSSSSDIAEDDFRDFWNDMSASIAADKDFTLILWNIFELNSRRSKSPTVRSQKHQNTTASPPPPPPPPPRQGSVPLEHTLPVGVESPVVSRGGYSRSRSPVEMRTPENKEMKTTREPSMSHSQQREASNPNSSTHHTGRRFVSNQGFGGGRSTLNIFGGDEDASPAPVRSTARNRPPPPIATPPVSVARSQVSVPSSQVSVPRSITGSMRGSTAVGRKQLHTERPF